MMTTLAARTAIAAGLAARPGTAATHRGVTGQPDAGTPMILAGTIARATFAPPHPVLLVQVEGGEIQVGDLGRPDEFTGPFVQRPGDVGAVREVEFPPVGTLYDPRDRVAAGDRVVVLALRTCLPPHEPRSPWAQLEGGEVVSHEGGLNVRVDGCS